MTKARVPKTVQSSFKSALSRSTRPIPGIKSNAPAGVSSNPFNMKVTKPKFEVLNRNMDRSARGSSVVSRSRAEAVRNATILPQLKEIKRGHASTFIDRRFGERDKTMSREEKMQERFSREHQRRARAVLKKSRSRFDLNDDVVDDEGLGQESLTHRGRSLLSLDEDELATFSGEEDEEGLAVSGALDRNFVRESNFGGFGEGSDSNQGPPKSRQEIMRELISKSKFYKAERQKQRDADAALTEDLDASFSALRGGLSKVDASARRLVLAADEDDYEGMLKELAFDPRAQPTDRTLTAEEAQTRAADKALKEREAMLARMQDADENDLDTDSGSGKRHQKHTSPDGLESSKARQDTTKDSDHEEDEAVQDPELLKQISRLEAQIDSFCSTALAAEAQGFYEELASVAKTAPRMMIHVGRRIRQLVGEHAQRFTDRSNETGRGAVMPPLPQIRLLLLVARLFSCSDFHHVVATPAQLLLSYYLAVGRMTRLEHVVRALALVQVSLDFQTAGQRCIPEALELCYTVLNASAPAKDLSNHYFCRPLGKAVVEALKAAKSAREDSLSAKQLLFAEDADFSAAQVVETVKAQVVQWLEILSAGSYPALVEMAEPFRRFFDSDPLQQRLEAVIANGESVHTPLQLQQHKPLALPMLTPDFELDYSLDSRGDRNAGGDERSAARMRAAYRREYKGAVRELKRDAAFLADKKIQEKKSADEAYRARINHIMGSIGNENVSASQRPKK